MEGIGTGTLEELTEILIGLKEVSEDWGKTRLGISSGVKLCRVLNKSEFHPTYIKKTMGLSSDRVGIGVGMT